MSREELEPGRAGRRARSPAKSFQDLIVWQMAHGFVLAIYEASRPFPGDDRFGLTSQLRRATISIPANIAEGFRKQSRADKTRYLNIAEGSLEECRYYLILSRDLDYFKDSHLWDASEEVARLLNAYRSAILTSRSQLPTPNSSPHPPQ